MPSHAGLTHPDRILWPALGRTAAVTKGDLAGYYRSAAPWMIPHLRGRPCTILRAPRGIGGETFLQKHLPDPGEGLQALPPDPGREPCFTVLDTRGLQALAQISAVELHPANGWPFQDDVPGRLVFDLDPGPGVAFDALVTAARALRRRLEDLGLAGFCKTSGGRGLHVSVPLAPETPGPDWAEARQFARRICAGFANASPDAYVLSADPSLRPGRIYLDWLRNDRVATAVAPLSPRARPGAPVSMPLTWDQVRPGLDPGVFTVRTALDELSRSGAWSDWTAAARPLSEAIRRLAAAD
jgi:bifunctional non-homologous end joining protein LigD